MLLAARRILELSGTKLVGKHTTRGRVSQTPIQLRKETHISVPEKLVQVESLRSRDVGEGPFRLARKFNVDWGGWSITFPAFNNKKEIPLFSMK